MNQTFTITRDGQVDKAFQRKQAILSLVRRFETVDYAEISQKVGTGVLNVLRHAVDTDPNRSWLS